MHNGRFLSNARFLSNPFELFWVRLAGMKSFQIRVVLQFKPTSNQGEKKPGETSNGNSPSPRPSRPSPFPLAL